MKRCGGVTVKKIDNALAKILRKYSHSDGESIIFEVNTTTPSENPDIQNAIERYLANGGTVKRIIPKNTKQLNRVGTPMGYDAEYDLGEFFTPTM